MRFTKGKAAAMAVALGLAAALALPCGAALADEVSEAAPEGVEVPDADDQSGSSDKATEDKDATIGEGCVEDAEDDGSHDAEVSISSVGEGESLSDVEEYPDPSFGGAVETYSAGVALTPGVETGYVALKANQSATFTFSVADSSSVAFKFAQTKTSPSGDSIHATLENESGKILYEWDITYDTTNVSFGKFIVGPGKHLIRMTPNRDVSVMLKLGVEELGEGLQYEQEPNNTEAAATSIVAGKTYIGTAYDPNNEVFMSMVGLMGMSDIDQYKIRLDYPSDMTLAFLTQGALQYEVRTSSSRVKQGSLKEGSTSVTLPDLPAGTYYVAVVSTGGSAWGKEYALQAQVATTNLAAATITVSDQSYTGTPLTPAIAVKLGGATLKEGTDYTVSYSNNVNAGTATVEVKGRGRYSGTKSASFKIKAISLASASVSIAPQTYTGKALCPTPTVKLGNKTLRSGSDYTVTYSNNVSVGTATAKIVGKGNYAGSKTATFKISQKAQQTSNAGWVQSGSKWWYRNADGSYPASCWKQIDGSWYLFDGSGYMRTGWAQVGGSWYYLKGSGAMATGWQQVGGSWYYLKGSGAMATGWYTVDGEWNWSDGSGVWHANKWTKDSRGWWYAWADGTYPRSSWQKIDGSWYYFDGSGYMQSSCWVGNYWLTGSGAMATNAWVDGGRYYVGSDGVYVSSDKAKVLARAQSYLRSSNFSRNDLIKQLEYEGFSNADSTWAVNHCGADWREQALGKAKSYLRALAFSRTGLIGQLEYHHFSSDEVSYAIENCGADWRQEAYESARSYLSSGWSRGRDRLVEQLEFEGFTNDQAVYGVDKAMKGRSF